MAEECRPNEGDWAPGSSRLSELSAAGDAAELWTKFQFEFARLRPSADATLGRVIEADPGFAAAQATAAVLSTLRPVDGIDTEACAAAARSGTIDHEWERSFVDAALKTVDHGRWAGLKSWQRHHDRFPADSFSLGFFLTTMLWSTDPDLFDDAERRLRRTLDEVGDDPVLLSHLAMSAADRLDLDDAHRLASRALELEPTLANAAHPLAHVFYESGDHHGGADWLGEQLPDLDQQSVYIPHLVWHAALHELSLGRDDAVLRRYEQCGSPESFNQIIDGPSLLWRCQLHGLIEPGSDPLSPIVAESATPFADDVPMTFLGCHAALAMAAVGDAEGLERFATAATEFTAPGAPELLPSVARGLAAYVAGDHTAAADHLLSVEGEVWRLGGSLAQREVFEDTLIEALVRAERTDLALERLHRRLGRRPSRLDDGWLGRCPTP